MDKPTIAWVVAYAYLVYTFVGQLPGLTSASLFSLKVSSVLLIVLYLFHSYINFGWKNASKYLAIVLIVSYAIEFAGTQTGIPFGRYSYTGGLAPLLGPVPLFIPFLWAALGYFSLVAAGNYLEACVLMVLLDVSFDPRFSRSLWHWAVPGQYFGVPLSNFVGWFVTPLAFYLIFYLLSRKRPESTVLAIGFYLLLGVNNVISDVNSGLGTAGEISLVLFASASLLLYVARVHRAGAGVDITGLVSWISLSKIFGCVALDEQSVRQSSRLLVDQRDFPPILTFHGPRKRFREFSQFFRMAATVVPQPGFHQTGEHVRMVE